MRKLLLFILVFTFAVVSAQLPVQNTQVFSIKQIPSEGVFLNHGWKLHTDDHPAYAHASLDDSKWQAIDPGRDVHELPQIKNGIVWFRLNLHLDSGLLHEALALTIQQSGASEIFVNGKLLHRWGTISVHPEQTKAYDPSEKPIPVNNFRGGDNVIAVRYALQPYVRYTYLMGKKNPVLQVTLCDMQTGIALYQREKTRSAGSVIFRIGSVLILFVLHFVFYIFYPAKKANLYFSLFAFTTLTTTLLHLNEPKDLNGLFYFRNIITIGGSIGTLFLFIAFYTILKEKKAWVFWSIMALYILSALLQALQIGATISVILGNLVYLEAFRLITKAIISKQKGAWIIAAGGISAVVFHALFLLGFSYGYANSYITTSFTYGDLLYNLYSLSIPIAISLYLGFEFAVTNSALTQKLLEVENLSKKTLQQEREKQQLLASQNETLEQLVAQRTAALNTSLEKVKSAQAQLIQSEKMASLGELTAGIAHEIQNPLNFVNNFSETNTELIEEARTELKAGNVEEVQAILTDIKGNEEKINTHGKRADAIVKGMLQHSRKNIGEKQLTDINALTDEYLRLSCHGMRAKDKSFNTTMRTSFDENIRKAKIVPQDIGRVLLNLFNNAFYAVNEKKKTLGEMYEPTVSVKTKIVSDKIEISVQDNGTGISKSLLDKIFQPFFTTKPTGQGTGLGLSLSYDILKAHGGEISVVSTEGEGTTFVVHIPVT